jgi:carboxyl-terminal processing protease
VKFIVDFFKVHKVSSRWAVALVISAVAIGGGVAWQSCATASARPGDITTTPASQPGSVPAAQSEAASLRDEGLKVALTGRFRLALEDIRKASQLAPEDSVAARAKELLERYLQRQSVTQADRKREYQYELERIRWANLAQRYQHQLRAKPYAKALRKKIRTELRDAYHAMGTSEQIEESSVQEALKLQASSLEQIKKTYQVIRSAVSLLKGTDDAFGDAFRTEAKTLEKRLGACEAIWKGAKLATPKERWATARDLRHAEESLADAMTDIQVMVAKDPWKIGLLHAVIANEVAPDKEHFHKSKLYRDLLQATETRGREAIAKAKWYDALSAFAGLKELEPTNDVYRQQATRVGRHVRALRLYGGGNDDEDKDEDAEDQAKSESEEPDDVLWKQMVAGSDAQMVRKAISKIGTSYVKTPDYRQLTRGALQSVKILAQTPQVAETFPGLADKAKLKAFIDSLDKQLELLDKKQRVDHLDLQMALNRVMDSSEATVNIPLEVLVVEFTDGFLGKLDKFSNMIWPQDVTNFNKSTMGKFTGIGVQITKERGKPLKVVTPLLGTPAYKAKIKAGDLIMKVDGVSTKKLSVDKLVKRIMGPPGSTVKLLIKRRGLAKPFVVPVVRQDVHIRTVKGWRRDKSGHWDFILKRGSNKIGYIRITQFTGTTYRDLDKALRNIRQAGANSLILDLRSNPGGLLRSATAVADEFLDDVRRIVFTRGRSVPRNEVNSTPRGTFQQGNLVVLIDNHSASAAEILSGAMKDYHRGIIIGQRSYGKGSVQNVIPVRSSEAYLKLTTAYYYLPSGRLLHRQKNSKDWGVDPDIDVYVTPRQMRRWMGLRRKADLLQDVAADILDADLAAEYKADLQLDTAVLVLKLKNLQAKSKPAPRVVAGS